jgi:arylsulfatase A-like enzyme
MITRRLLLASAFAKPARPHLVLFLADDHGRLDSPLYGSRVIRTPALQQLARNGMVFDNCFTGAAICIPSRAIIGSGLCSHRNGAIANGRPMNRGIKTLPAYLRELGYRVAHFGKGHFLPADSYAWEAVPSEIKGEGPLNADLDTNVFDRWLSEAAAGKDPLCLVVCCHSPHVTWPDNNGYDPASVELPGGSVDTPETRAMRCRYYTDITKMDRQLGEITASVQRHLGGNALFLYTSDNGPQWPFAKWNLYDAGIRMPMVAVWPGVIKAGSRTAAMVQFADILPTFIDLAGGATPPGDLDGRSFARVLAGKSGRHHAEVFAAHTADDNGHMNCYPMRAVRDGRYKYILNLRPDLAYRTHIDRGVARDGRTYWDSWVERARTGDAAMAVVRRYHKRPEEEFYDTLADPHETANLAIASRGDHRERLRRMRARVRAWMDGMGDKGELFGVPRPLDKEGLIVS